MGMLGSETKHDCGAVDCSGHTAVTGAGSELGPVEREQTGSGYCQGRVILGEAWQEGPERGLSLRR